MYYPGYAPQARVLRELAKDAGVHVFTDSDAGFFHAGQHLLVLGAGPQPCVRRVRLPQRSTVYDVFAGRVIARRASEMALNMRADSTLFLFVGSGREVRRFRKAVARHAVDPRAWQWRTRRTLGID